jgi:hypothetical protein
VEVCVLVKKYRSEFNEYGDEIDVEDGEEEQYGYVYGMGALQRAWVNVMTWDGKQITASLEQIEPVYHKGKRGISIPWQPKEGEPVAAVLSCYAFVSVSKYVLCGGKPCTVSNENRGGATPADFFYRLEGSGFDPKNPDHYAVTWWENCGTDIWKP